MYVIATCSGTTIHVDYIYTKDTLPSYYKLIASRLTPHSWYQYSSPTHSDTQPSSLTPVPALCFKSHNPGYKPTFVVPVLKPTTHGVLDLFAAAILSFLARHPDHHRPLFIREDGSPLTKYPLVKQVRLALSQKSIEMNIYSGHRF